MVSDPVGYTVGPKAATVAGHYGSHMKKAERRQQLLGVAIDILAAEGPPGLRLDRLALKAGVTLARARQYFPEDAALCKLAFAAVLERALPSTGKDTSDP